MQRMSSRLSICHNALPHFEDVENRNRKKVHTVCIRRETNMWASPSEEAVKEMTMALREMKTEEFMETLDEETEQMERLIGAETVEGFVPVVHSLRGILVQQTWAEAEARMI